MIFYWTTVSLCVGLATLYLSLSSALSRSVDQKLNTVIDILGVIISNQEHLDADVAALTAAATAIADQIAALKAQPAAEALDFSGLDAVVSTLQGIVAPAPDAGTV